MRARRRAEIALDALDAELARWLVSDGTLSTNPLQTGLRDRDWRLELRARRLDAVRELERAGGKDPHPSFLREPTPAQRAGYAR